MICVSLAPSRCQGNTRVRQGADAEVRIRRVYIVSSDLYDRAKSDTRSVRATRLTGQLIFIFLAWPIGVATAALLSTAERLSIGYWIYYLGTFFSPVLGGVLIVIALRHNPVLHRFLKFVVVLSLIALIQTNFTCATMAKRRTSPPSIDATLPSLTESDHP